MAFGTYVIFAGLIVTAIGITSAAIQGQNAQSWSYFLIVIGVLLVIIGALLLMNTSGTSTSKSKDALSASGISTSDIAKVAKAAI